MRKSRRQRRIEGLIRAIEEGLYEPLMQALERRREALGLKLATAAGPKSSLHPGLAEIYRENVATLQEVLVAEDDHEVREAIRALVEAVLVVPDDGRLAIEVRGIWLASWRRAGFANSGRSLGGVSAWQRRGWLAGRRDDDETIAPGSQPGFEGEGGFGRHRGREETLAELAPQFDVHANQITAWKALLLEGAAGVFGSASEPEPGAPAVDVKTLHAKIGELTLAHDFVAGALGKAGLLGARRRSTDRTTCPSAAKRKL